MRIVSNNGASTLSHAGVTYEAVDGTFDVPESVGLELTRFPSFDKEYVANDKAAADAKKVAESVEGILARIGALEAVVFPDGTPALAAPVPVVAPVPEPVPAPTPVPESTPEPDPADAPPVEDAPEPTQADAAPVDAPPIAEPDAPVDLTPGEVVNADGTPSEDLTPATDATPEEAAAAEPAIVGDPSVETPVEDAPAA